MKLVNAKMVSQKLKNDQTYYTNEKSQITNEKSPICNTSLNNNLSTTTEKHFEFQKITEDILCAIKNSKELTEEDNMESGMDNVKKQIECDRSTISEASFIDDAEDDIIDQSKRQKTKGVTQSIYSVPNLEDKVWKNVQKSSRKRKSINLTPNCEILLRNIDSRAKTKVIGLIKNGSKSKFMSVKCNNGNYVLSNTCSFDTIVQMLAVAYCDSIPYTKYVIEKKEESTLWQLIFCLLRNGVTVQTYIKRAEILSNLYPGEPILNGITHLSVEQSIDSMLNMLLKNYESVQIEEKCSSCKFERSEKKPLLTICVTEKMPTKRQLNLLINEEIKLLYNSTFCKKCTGLTEVTVVLGDHIFFNLINLNNTTDAQFTDTRIFLNHIPKYIFTLQSQYYLRELGTTPDSQQVITSPSAIGHYHAHVFRNPINSWQIYDGIKEKVLTVSEKNKVNLQIILYSK